MGELQQPQDHSRLSLVHLCTSHFTDFSSSSCCTYSGCPLIAPASFDLLPEDSASSPSLMEVKKLGTFECREHLLLLPFYASVHDDFALLRFDLSSARVFLVMLAISIQ